MAENNLLEFRSEAIINIRKEYNLDKPGEMDRAIDVLELWIQKQAHFIKKDFSRLYLEKMIIANKGSIERAKIKLDKICTFRTMMPEFFGDHLTKHNFNDIDELLNVLLPKQTDDNYRVYLLKNIGQQFTSEQIMNYYRFVVMLCEYVMAHDYSNGIMIVIDYTETNMVELMKHIHVTELRQIIAIVTEGFGMRLKGIHMITTSKAIDALVTIMKQLLSAKVGSRICVHKDISTVYQYVPKDILPSEYGGKEKSLIKLRDEFMDALTSKNFRVYLEEMNKAKTDEAYRQTDKFNDQYMGMPGSFRTLSVD